MGIFACIIMGLCALVCLCAVAAGAGARILAEAQDDQNGIRGVSAIVFVVVGFIGFLFLIGSTLTIVPTKEIGIVTTFGRVNYEMPNGPHLTYPWQNMTPMDGAIQLEKFDGAEDFEHHGNAVLVTLGNNTKAYANVNIQWRLDPHDLGALYQNFRSFGAIKDNLVNTNFFQALNAEFASFDPLACLAEPPVPGNDTPKCTTPDGGQYGALSERVKNDVQKAMTASNVGGKVVIDRVIITNIVYKKETQDALNDLLAEKGRTRVAQQREATADADAAANEKLRASVSNDPNVLVSKCLDAHKDSSPIGCWPGSVGPGVPVLQVPAAK